jgi:hypothetical protein
LSGERHRKQLPGDKLPLCGKLSLGDSKDPPSLYD